MSSHVRPEKAKRVSPAFIRDNVQQLRLTLDNRNIEYRFRYSRSGKSVTFWFTVGGQDLCVKIADHVIEKANNKYTIHPGSRGTSMTRIRALINTRWVNTHYPNRKS